MFIKQKRKFTIAMMLVMVLSVVFGALAPIMTLADSEVKIDIVHFNDIHGRIDEDEWEGATGFAKIQTKLKELKKANPNLLVLDGGDTLHGTTVVNLSEGENILELMKDLGFDAMVVGNHDFNYGYERLVELKDMASFPIITANVEKDGKSDFKPYIIKEVDGIKIGIFGLTTEESTFKTHPNNIKGVEFISPIKASEKYVKELKDQGADFIIALTHLGVEGIATETSEDVLNAVDGIDLMIDGHSHEVTDKKIKDALLVQAGEYTKNLGLIEITFKDKKVEKIDTKLLPYEELKDLEPDKEVSAKIEKFKKENEKVLNQVVGKTKVKLDGERENVRTKETNLANLVTDVIRENTKADIGFMTGGNIRASIEPGDVTIGDIITSFPFANTIMVKEITGEEMRQSLENGLTDYPEAAGQFPQVSGMSYSFNPKAPVGQRVVDIKIGDKPMDPKGKYTLATNDFLAAGGDGYKIFAEKPVLAEGALLSDMVIEYFQKNEEVEPKVEGRITIDESQVIPISPDAIKIEIDGKVLEIPAELGAPFIKDNRTLVPLRAVSEGLGHKVDWDGDTRTVTIDEKIKLTIDSKTVQVDEKEVELDVAATLKDSRTYVPIRFISETLGYEVDWNGDTRTVIIKTVEEKPVEEKPAA